MTVLVILTISTQQQNTHIICLINCSLDQYHTIPKDIIDYVFHAMWTTDRYGYRYCAILMELTECCVTLAGCALPLRIEYNIAKSRKRILKWHKVSKVYYSAESSRSYVKYDSYCIKLRLVTLRCIKLHCITLHYIALYGKCGRGLAWLSPIGSSVVTPRPSCHTTIQ